MTVKEIVDFFDFDCKMKYKVEPSYKDLSRQRYGKEYYNQTELYVSPYIDLEVIGHKIHVGDKVVVLIISNKDYLIAQGDFLSKELAKYKKLIDEFDDFRETDLHGEE